MEVKSSDTEVEMSQLLATARGESESPANDDWCNSVKSTIGLNWTDQSLSLQQSFRDWIIAMASTSHFRIILESLFETYTRSLVASPEEKVISPGLNEFLLQVANDLCRLVPVAIQVLPPVVLQNQPIIRRSASVHAGYCTAVLHFSLSAGVIRQQLIATVISHILSLDVRVSRDVVAFSKQPGKVSNDIVELIDKIDKCMTTVFDFIDSLQDKSKDESNLVMDFFFSALTAFDAVVFRSTSASHINFILFYACARYPQLSAYLLDHMWSRIVAEDKAEESRCSAISYFVSFATRAKFLTLDQIRTSVEHLTQFAHYLKSKISPTEKGSAEHQGYSIMLFCTSVEALLYVLAFHHKTLCSGSLGFRFVRSLKLGELINSSSDPLSRCRESVVGMFYQVAEKYHLYLSERASRTSCRTESICSAASTPGEYEDTAPFSPMSTFGDSKYFPFDPYLLPSSSQRLNTFYAEFDSSDLLVSSDESDEMEDEEDIESDHEFDDDNVMCE